MDPARHILDLAKAMEKHERLEQHIIADITLQGEYNYKVEFTSRKIDGVSYNIIRSQGISYKIPKKEKKEFDDVLMRLLQSLYHQMCYQSMLDNYEKGTNKNTVKIYNKDVLCKEYNSFHDPEKVLKESVFEDLKDLKYV